MYPRMQNPHGQSVGADVGVGDVEQVKVDVPSIPELQIIFNLDMQGREGIPNNARESLLQQERGDVALVLDVAYFCGWREGHVFSVQQFIDVAAYRGIQIAAGLVRRALADRLFRVAKKLSRRRGRPRLFYTLPGIAEIVQREADGNWQSTDKLQAADLHNLKTYRAGLHREFVRRCAGRWSRRFLGARLGVGKRSTRNYEKLLGNVRVTPCYEEEDIHYGNVGELPGRAPSGRAWLMACPKPGEWKPGQVVQHLPLNRYLALSKLREGLRVIKVIQLTNRYEIDQMF